MKTVNPAYKSCVLLGLKTKQNLMIPNLRFVKKRYISHLLPLLFQCLCRITFLPYFIFVPVLTFVTWNYTTMSLMLEKKEIWLWRILIIEYSFYLVFFSHRHRAHYGSIILDDTRWHKGVTVGFNTSQPSSCYLAVQTFSLSLQIPPEDPHIWIKKCSVWALSHDLVCTAGVWFWCWIKPSLNTTKKGCVKMFIFGRRCLFT